MATKSPDVKPKLPRINFEVDPDTYQAVREATGTARGVSVREWMTDAIHEKLGNTKARPDVDALTHLYDSLTDDGKAWLMRCATIAASSDEVRQIIPRSRKTDTDEE